MFFWVSPPFSSGILLFLSGRGGRSFSAPKFQVAINVLPELVLALSALHLGKMLRWARDDMISDAETMGYPLVILNINIQLLKVTLVKYVHIYQGKSSTNRQGSCEISGR